MVSKVKLIGGIHKFLFIFKKASDYVKVGVTTTNKIQKNKAFCDFESGFAFFTKGSLRNGSEDSGLPYGKRISKKKLLKEEIIVEMEINMGDGIIYYTRNSG